MTPLVLVHGVGLDRHMWDPFVDALTRPARAYDMIGHGDEPPRAGQHRLADYAEQLRTIASETGSPVDIVGFSMGALVAQRLAIDSPAAVRRLVLVSGVFDRAAAERAAIRERVADVRAGGYRASVEPALDRWFTPEFAQRCPDVVDTVRRRMLANDVTAYGLAYEVFATGDEELAPLVRRITAPTLVVTGADDQRSTPSMARRLAAAIPGASAAIVPGVRHLLPLEQPAGLALLVAEFLCDAHDPEDPDE